MATSRRYRLLCPIARALDRVGDRWALLILRDLHAGPARFADLQTGLAGIAPNILSDRLAQLSADGLIMKEAADYGVTLYRLTELGARTGNVLFELAMLGGAFPADEAPKPPGNLRTVATTMGATARRVATDEMSFVAEVEVDGEPFTLRAGDDRTGMTVGRPDAPDVVIRTSYEPLLAVSEGEMPVEEFLAHHRDVEERTEGKAAEAAELLSRIMALFRGA